MVLTRGGLRTGEGRVNADQYALRDKRAGAHLHKKVKRNSKKKNEQFNNVQEVNFKGFFPQRNDI